MSLLIKGGDIVDGSGGAPKKGDVLLIAGRIAAIGNLASYKAERTVSANGCLVVPGFIDMASGADRRLSILSDHKAEELLLQGITTIIGGTSGISLAPLMYGSLEAVSNWSKWEAINVDWHSMEDFMNILGSTKSGVNFASFVGYDTVRRSLSKKKRSLSKSESQVMAHTLSSAIHDGALGISLSAEDSVAPDMSAEEARIFGLLLQSEKAILAADLPLFLKKAGEAVESIVKWTKLGAPTIIQKFTRAAVSAKELARSFEIMESASVSARIIASACPLGIDELSVRSIVPESAWSEDPKELSANILKKRNSATIDKYWTKEKLSELWITDAPKADFLVGKNVAEFAENREVDATECFAKIVDITSGRVSFCIESEKKKLTEEVILHPRVVIESGAYGSMNERSDFHKKLGGAFPEFFEIANRSGLNIEKAVAKTSTLPAATCGLGKRGLIEEGYAADVVVMKDRRPHWVFVNGIESVREGELTGDRGGKVIKRHV